MIITNCTFCITRKNGRIWYSVKRDENDALEDAVISNDFSYRQAFAVGFFLMKMATTGYLKSLLNRLREILGITE